MSEELEKQIKKLKLDLLEESIYGQVIMSTGVYCKSVKKRDGTIIERTEYQDGWNDHSSHILKKACEYSKLLNEIDEDTRVKISDLVYDEAISIEVVDGKLYFSVNCNDLFYWACSDEEEIELSELDDLIACKQETKRYTSLWCCRKRKMRPQKPVLDGMKDKKEKQLFLDCGPERDEQ